MSFITFRSQWPSFSPSWGSDVMQGLAVPRAWSSWTAGWREFPSFAPAGLPVSKELQALWGQGLSWRSSQSPGYCCCTHSKNECYLKNCRMTGASRSGGQKTISIPCFSLKTASSLHISGETKDAAWAEKERQRMMCAARWSLPLQLPWPLQCLQSSEEPVASGLAFRYKQWEEKRLVEGSLQFQLKESNPVTLSTSTMISNA